MVKTQIDSERACVSAWRELHRDHAYFTTHPHYRGRPLDTDGVFADQMDAVIGLKPDDDVLEIGCGYGRLMAGVAPRVNSVAGIDLDEQLIVYAAARLSGFDNTRAVVCDGLSIPFDDSAFTLVYSASTFQHTPRSVAARYISETHRVLRSGGRTFIQFLADQRSDCDIDPALISEQSIGWTDAQVQSVARTVFDQFVVHFMVGADASSIILVATKT